MKVQLVLWILIMELNFSMNKALKRHCYQALEKSSTKEESSPKIRVLRSASEYVQGGLKPITSGICSTWGNFHFKTFDGEVFRFPGLCNYIFASHCGKLFEDFNIQIQQFVVDKLPTITQVSIKINGLVVELKDHYPTIHGEPLELPFSQSGIQIEQSDEDLKVTAKMILVLIWHNDNSINLKLNKKYMGETCGLCSDYNGNPKNDFVFKGRTLTPIEFGIMHKLRLPEQTCVDPKPETGEECFIYRAMCIKLLRNSKWTSCNMLVKAEPYIEAYMHDMCLCNASVTITSFCLCNTITEYSRQCAIAGGRPPEWRNPALCFKKCNFNLIYKECSSPCAPTCSNPGRPLLCDGSCEAGCDCPNGYVLDDITNSGCLPIENCSCSYNNEVYPPGSSYQAPCYTCLCYEGHWSCDDLPCPSTCSVEGGAHITTFDKAHYTFHGKCFYVLAKSFADNAFLVTIEMQKCGYGESSTCIIRVVLALNKGAAIFEINYDKTNFPHTSYDKEEIARAGVNIFWPSSFFMIVQTNKGLQLQVQLTPIMQLYVILDPSYKRKTCGLCGNFNDIQRDDFRTSSGAIEVNIAEFANTWKTQYSCNNVKNIPEHPCTLGMEIEKYAHYWCNLLIDEEGPFAACHGSVSPEVYQQNCLFDTCLCKRAEDCMCAALSSYVRACAIVGVSLIGWREDVCKTYMGYCPPSFVYSYTVTSCIPTCRSLSEPDPTCSIKFFPVDGCVCKKGTYLDDNGVCVHKDNCPCYYRGVAVSANNALHVGRLICTCTEWKINCIEKEIPVCHPPMVYFDCDNAGAGVKGSECPHSCQTSEAQCYSPLCVSGCVCPKGLALHSKGNCIKDEQCPCFRNGVSYQPGEKVIIHCNECVCNNRTWVCDTKADMGICTIYGEGHYITFDSKHYTVNGDCEYTLVQDYCNIYDLRKGTFRVIIENIPCGTTGTSCSKAIIVYVGTHKLILTDEHIEVVEIFNQVEIPYKVRRMGIFLVIEASNGLVLVWDRMTSIFIHLSRNFKGNVCGLCGNFDGNSNNDFTTRSQCVVEDVTEFRDSWKLSPTCPEVLMTKDPCTANPYRKAWATKICNLITSDVFSACHSEVDPDKYYEGCVSDTCACDTGGDCNCYCTAIAAYSQACSEACVCVKWRTPTICPVFCDLYNGDGQCEWHYRPCGASCMKTCKNPSGECLHKLKGLEGCYPKCPEDKPYFDEDEMQCVAQCGCLLNEDKYYELGEKVESCNSCEICLCTTKGILCHYDIAACYCEFNGQMMRINENITMEDERGGCWNVTCTANGTVVNTYNLTTEASTVAPPTICQYEACTWSEWYDVSKPSPTRDGGDYETFQNIKAAGYTICKGLKDVACRASSFINTPLELLKQKVTCNTMIGLICKNTDQHTEFFQFCYNYQIRLRCCNYIPCTTGVPASTREVISTSISTTRTPKSTAMTKGKYTTQNPNMITERDIPIATVTLEEHSTIPEKPFEASATTKGPFKASTRTTALVIASGPGPVRPTTSVSYSASTAATVVSRTTLAITQASSRTAPQIQELLLLRSFSKITSKPVKSLISHVTSTIHEVKSTDQQAMLSSFYSDCLTATCSDNGNLDVKGVLCPKVKNITCEGGRPPKRIYDQDGCCYHYQCKICVGYDGTNKSPGETWIDNCLECSCDIDRLEIFCKPLDCVEPDLSICDQPWLEPFQVLTDEDRCCPKIECRCVPAYCRNLTGDCPLGYEAVGTIEEEDCCITFECKPKNVCVFKGNMYQVGKSIWTDKSSCKDCQCLDTKDPQTGLNVVSCEPIRCMTNCPLGYFYHRPQGVCCGQCVQVSCVVKMNNGSVYLLQPGESRFLSEDNCTRYTCEVIKEHMVTASKTQICPTLLEGECESGTVEKAPDGCCDVCKAAKSCKVQKKTTLISHKNCHATATLSFCEGSCPSLREFSMEKLSMEGTCGCCQELKTKQQEVELTCPNGEQSIPFTFTSAESCDCNTTVCTP